MRKHITVVLSLAVLLGVLSIGCNKTNEEFVCHPSCERGGKLLFGNYNGSPIEWYILANDTVHRRFMLLSMDTLGERAFHERLEPVTWERSTIRSWLNGYGPSENALDRDYTSYNFISKEFTSKDKAWIHKTTVVNNGNPDLGMGGTPTKDYVFLLSADELFEYIPEIRQEWPGHGELGDPASKLCTKLRCKRYSLWWLRTSSKKDPTMARYVNHLGAIGYTRTGDLLNSVDGYYYRKDGSAIRQCPEVRPALWLNY